MDDHARPSRQEISDATAELGWRLVLGAVYAEVAAPSLAQASQVAALAVQAAGDAGQGHLSVDIRADRAVLRLQSATQWAVTGLDIGLAHRISAELTGRGLRLAPGSVQAIEIAIDALDIRAVRPFWKAVTGYVDEPGPSDLSDGLVDPAGRGPAIWFQQMDAPRPQRNRIHLDVDVPHDAAAERIAAALAAGGTLLSDSAAPAFWVLADAEGNEVCICTWQGRD
ncbi:VOC family protein [Mycolicibacterium sphagni]|uniref:4a-hydroxytetrahydrobiopterin dehydratase n=1 Tax=Mycolicibacterium sphagni TaxID=1786 RepID=A0ABX2JLI7_9MYCO|nr:VOC family protein [Mycolicibacterium sphagni]NTY58553.1 4a-hydroxytetrahydrobiopterin dehydratase [Mycolicibacterium sphagni]